MELSVVFNLMTIAALLIIVFTVKKHVAILTESRKKQVSFLEERNKALQGDIEYRTATYRKLLERCHHAERHIQALSQENTKLRALKSGGSSQFTQEQIKLLMGLVHPDKHGGKESATKMFQLLNGMRK